MIKKILAGIAIIASFNSFSQKAMKQDMGVNLAGLVVKNQPTVISQFNNKFESIKPQYGFAIKGNKVQLLPIEKIMAKWDKPNETKPQPRINNAKSIFDKF